MTIQALVAGLTALMPTARYVFKSPQHAPYCVYLDEPADVIAHDFGVLKEILNVSIEIYTAPTDRTSATAVKKMLNANNTAYNEIAAVYIPEQELCEVILSVKCEED